MNRSFVLALSAIAVFVTCFVLPGLSAALSSPQDAKAKVEVKSMSKKLGKKLRFVETKNFTWASSMSAGKTKIVSAGAEKAYKIFADHAGINEWAKMWGNQKCMAILVPAKRDYIRFNKWFAENYKVWSKKQWPINKDLADYYCESAARRIMTTYVKPNSDAHVRITVWLDIRCHDPACRRFAIVVSKILVDGPLLLAPHLIILGKPLVETYVVTLGRNQNGHALLIAPHLGPLIDARVVSEDLVGFLCSCGDDFCLAG